MHLSLKIFSHIDVKGEISKIKSSFSKLKAEMDDHLDAINQNTDEINSASEYVRRLEEMVHKLGERLDELEMRLATGKGMEKQSYHDLRSMILTPKESEIFKILYETNGNLSDYSKLAKTIGYSEEMVRKTAESLISKGVPIIKKYFEGKVYLILDADFRNLQAKENIIRLD